VGLELYHQLQKMAAVPLATIPTFDNTHLTTRISVKISLMPADNIKPTAWELTLLVMLILLGTSIIFSGIKIFIKPIYLLIHFFFLVAMHFYMWKRNQHLQTMVERHRTTTAAVAVLPMGKALLTIARLYQFPTRTIDTVLGEEERKKVETVLSDEKQREALIKSTALTSKEPKRKSVFSKTKLLGKQSSTFADVKIDAPVNNMCVICLEAFKMGDEVRELPCHHEYHTICIDPWLTSKSCECPLCKFDCSDTKPEETVADPDGLIAAASVPGLRGKILRPYLRFKANRRRRIGQVGVSNDVERQQQVRQSSRQSTMVPPPSPGLRAALRALDAVETAALPITTTAEIDEHYQAYEEAQQYGHNDEEDTHSFVTDIPRQSTATNRTALTHDRANEEVDNQPRYSVTTNHDDTTANSISTYAPTSDGGLLPDIDVSSISLCSIDLGGLSEDFHNTFNYHR
jgi:hypothetical protein